MKLFSLYHTATQFQLSKIYHRHALPRFSAISFAVCLVRQTDIDEHNVLQIGNYTDSPASLSRREIHINAKLRVDNDF